MLVTLDGRAPELAGTHLTLTVRRAAQTLDFIRFKPFPFFERLRTTLF